MTLRTTFVRVEGCDHGVGKLVEAIGDQREVEFFESPAGPRLHRIAVPSNRVVPIELSAETRVFCQDQHSLAWWAGRVETGPISAEALQKAQDHYAVRFPNGHKALVSVSDLNVRWAHPIEDPTAYLAARVTDTPFFFYGRTEIVRYLAAQRASFGGLTAVASAAVELLEHQVTTVRRVLADPIERYLLADEVGLGKTIEAGLLIRQHVIDQPGQARVLVVVPAHLVSQWRSELETKFFLQTPGAVHVVSEEELVATPISASKVTMLVVDEAHRGALHAFDADPYQRLYYERLCQLARLTPRVLLLSGTPVLHQEDGFLAMLHLLDPEAYPLTEREAFRRRVRERQVIAEATSDLTDDASALFVGEALGRLEPLSEEDSRLAALCADVRARETIDLTDPLRVKSLRTLRSHLTEIYRLHRRLLRTRRDDRRVRMHLPQRNGVQVLEYEDPARAEAFDLLETWRLRWTGETQSSEAQSDDTSLFASWVEAALSHPFVLLREVDRRLSHWGGSGSGAPWTFDGEEQLLRTRRSIIAEALRTDSRTGRLVDWLKSNGDLSRVIVFVSDSEVARSVAETLTEAFGSRAIALHDRTKTEDERFQRNAALRVLVCDSEGEEGLNLQRFGATIVHYDLPLEPARIEQRIGRVDRLEARGRLRNIVLSSGGIYEAAWLRCVTDAIRVFHRSIAPLQYSLVEAISRIRMQLVTDGSSAFDAQTVRMSDAKHGLNAELRRIKSQEAIDALEIDPEGDAAFFGALQAADDEAVETGEGAVNSWLIERLQFVREAVGADAFRYIHDTRVPTLLPVLETLTRFESSIDGNIGRRQRSSEIPLSVTTFQRSVAEKAHVGLLRSGHPIVTALEALVRADDRGVAFAMWRQLPEFEGVPQRFWRFDFLVETDLRHALSVTTAHAISQEALKRRADDAFPLQYQTLWLDADLQEVRDTTLLAVLELPYLQHPKQGRRDFNVRLERWEIVDKWLSNGDWDDLCWRAREVAERRLREKAEFSDRCRTCTAALRESSARVAEALQSRISRLEGLPRAAEARTANFEATLTDALIAGIQAPAIRVDSVGAVFLANCGLLE